MISLAGFKVIHDDKVLNALQIVEWCMPEEFYDSEKTKWLAKPKFIDVMAINEDGNVVVIRDETWTFQFIPIVRGWNKVTE